MYTLNRKERKSILHPERVLQFGEGNFLRCFVDWQIDILNEKKGLDAGVVVVKPRNTARNPDLNSQDGLYTTVVRGYDNEGRLHNDKRLITCVNREISIYAEFDEFISIASSPALRFVFSNTTEAGIVFNADDRYEDRPPSSFPAKLTRFLHQRYIDFDGSSESGLILIPCELIDNNGEVLKEIVLRYADLWNLEPGFSAWIERNNTFCSTLVDRIVTGYPEAESSELSGELGYTDKFITAGEYFHLFVIQGPEGVGHELKLPSEDLDIRFVDDLKPYKQRKVGILNGCHTALVPIAWLCGFETVGTAVEDRRLSMFLAGLLENEIIPGLAAEGSGLTEADLREYAGSVISRFRNPYINHRLLSISLNSMTKFKTRLLPRFLQYCRKNNTVPPLMSLSLAALAVFCSGNIEGRSWPVDDEPEILNLFEAVWNDASDEFSGDKHMRTSAELSRLAEDAASVILGLDEHWGVPLGGIAGLREKLAEDILNILTQGMRKTLEVYL